MAWRPTRRCRGGLLDPAPVPTDDPWLALVVAQHAGADPSVARELAANAEPAEGGAEPELST